MGARKNGAHEEDSRGSQARSVFPSAHDFQAPEKKAGGDKATVSASYCGPNMHRTFFFSRLASFQIKIITEQRIG